MQQRSTLNLIVLAAANAVYVALVAAVAWATQQPAVLAACAALASNAYWLPLALGRGAR